jgi:transcription antitermination factor NusG
MRYARRPQTRNDAETMMTDSSWYAARIFYNRVEKVRETLPETVVQTYVPTHLVQQIDGSRTTWKREPIVSGLLFFRCDAETLKQIQHEQFGSLMVYRNAEGRPAPIPDKVMDAFIFVTSAEDKGLQLISIPPSELPGTRVRVTGGAFAGAEGFIRRIDHRKRFFVVIEGVVAVATSYIPAQWLEPIEPLTPQDNA